jgi:hypothetical protein
VSLEPWEDDAFERLEEENARIGTTAETIRDTFGRRS